MTGRKFPAGKPKGFYKAYKESSGSNFKGEHQQIVLRSEAQKVFNKVPQSDGVLSTQEASTLHYEEFTKGKVRATFEFFLYRKLINFYILPDDFDSLMVKTKKCAKCNVYFCT